jgi:hypothetical protein
MRILHIPQGVKLPTFFLLVGLVLRYGLVNWLRGILVFLAQKSIILSTFFSLYTCNLIRNLLSLTPHTSLNQRIINLIIAGSVLVNSTPLQAGPLYPSAQYNAIPINFNSLADKTSISLIALLIIILLSCCDLSFRNSLNLINFSLICSFLYFILSDCSGVKVISRNQ